MKFSCFKPESDHSQEVFRFTSFLSAGSNTLQEFLFRDRVVGFDVISANTRRCPDELTDETVRDRILWNQFYEINNALTESSGAFLEIIDPRRFRFLANN